MVGQEVTRLLVVATLILVPVVASAQAAEPAALNAAQRAELGELFKRAQRAYEAKNYLEAIGALRAAHAIFGEPNILYRIGDAYENLGDLANAAEYYRQYVAAAPQATDAGLVQRRIDDLERRAAALEEKLTQTTPERAALLLDSNPAGAMVRLDDRAIDGVTPVRVEVAPGMHRVELQRDGFVSVVREIRIEPDETISLVYQLERIETAPPVAVRPSPWPWIVGGAGVASLGASAGLLLGFRAADSRVAAWDQERLAAHDDGTQVLARPEGYDASVRNRVIFRNGAIIAGGVGVLAVAGATLWLLLRGKGGETSVGTLKTSSHGLSLAF